MTPTVFLDIDGVLNSTPFLLAARLASPAALLSIHDDATWLDMLDPTCVARLDALVRRTGAHVVISSSWRHAHPHATGKIARWLAAKGFTGDVVGETVDNVEGGRCREIAEWSFMKGGIDPYVVLDDNTLCDRPHGRCFPASRLVRTDMRVGLTDADVKAAVAMLGVAR